MSNLREALKWQERAACAGTDLHMFFLEENYPEAKAVCARCPVQMKCREENMQERHGVFGGLDEKERAKLGGARAPYLPDFKMTENGKVIDEGLPAPAEPDYFLRFDPTTPDGKRAIRRMVDLYTDGMTTAEVAKELCIGETTVRRYVSESGAMRSLEEAKAQRNEKKKGLREACVEMYNEGFGLKHIGQELALSPSSVRRYVEMEGVTIRKSGLNPHAAQRMMAARGFSGTLMKEREEAAKRRKEAMAERDLHLSSEVVRLYKDGMGLKAVSAESKISVDRVRRILNGAGVEIRTGGANPESIRRMKEARGYGEGHVSKERARELRQIEKTKIKGQAVSMYLDGEKMATICGELGLSVMTVRRAVVESGNTLRASGRSKEGMGTK